MDYVIHRDGTVTRQGEVVGELLTGDNGLAYVQFLDEVLMPTPDEWFTVNVGEWNR